MAPKLHEFQGAPDAVIALLAAHLPRSLPALRRLQFIRIEGGPAPTSRVLLASDRDLPDLLRESTAPVPATTASGVAGAAGPDFAVAYVDMCAYPKTQMYMYSTLEDGFETGVRSDLLPRWEEEEEEEEISGEGRQQHPPQGAGTDRDVEQVLAILRRCRGLAADAVAAGLLPKDQENSIIIGTLNEELRKLLTEGAGVRSTYWTCWDKWLFRTEALPRAIKSPLEPGMTWDKVRVEDCPLIIRRSKVMRTVDGLLALPSTMLRAEDGSPVAWAFLGFDGALSTLHCEEPYRGRGIAKAAATKLIRAHGSDYGDDGWCVADVATDNVRSQSVCRSLGGKVAWACSWNRFALDSISESI